jgi:hypothetical protein
MQVSALRGLFFVTVRLQDEVSVLAEVSVLTVRLNRATGYTIGMRLLCHIGKAPLS